MMQRQVAQAGATEVKEDGREMGGWGNGGSDDSPHTELLLNRPGPRHKSPQIINTLTASPFSVNSF